MPATGALMGTPPSIRDSDDAHTEAMDVEPFDDSTSDTRRSVGPLLERGHHRQEGPLGEEAVADLSALGAADATGLAVEYGGML